MQIIIEPGGVGGTIQAPPSKSMTQRAYAAALLHRGKTIITHTGQSADELAALHIIQQLGALVTIDGDTTTITSSGINPTVNEISCGESGLAARLFIPIAATAAMTITITGTGSLLKRPMTGMAEVLPALGVSISNFNGCLPVTLLGPMQAASARMDAAGGSQLLSGLLFALCSCAKAPVTIEVTNLKSKPYIDMTLDVLWHFGHTVSHSNYRKFYIDPSLYTHTETVNINIEGDWSSAAALLVAGAIAGSVTVSGLNPTSKQADRAITDILISTGANVAISDESITVKKARLQAFEYDATDSPDLFPVLAILAACCEGESYIKGVHRLFDKESNRAMSISEMLDCFAVPYSAEDDTLCITGVQKLQGTIIDSFNDHRIAMAASIGALRANGQVNIEGAEAVNKSYPEFFNDLNRIIV